MITKDQLARLNKFKPLHHVLDYGTARLFINHPFKFAGYALFKKLFYDRGLRPNGKEVTVTTFFDREMKILLPGSLDLYFFGLKSYPSEIALSNFLIKNLNEEDCFFDIGAHYGFFSMLAAELCGHVVSVEASPDNYKILKANAREKITALNYAANNEAGMVSFTVFPAYYSEQNTLDSSQYQDYKWFQKNGGRKVSIPATTIDELVRSNKKQPKIIKIDTEGAEDRVLRGGSDYFRNHSATVIIEYINQPNCIAPYLRAEAYMRGLGYQAFYIQQDGSLLEAGSSVLEFMIARQLVSENIVFRKLPDQDLAGQGSQDLLRS